jgi:hypothetical protein
MIAPAAMLAVGTAKRAGRTLAGGDLRLVKRAADAKAVCRPVTAEHEAAGGSAKAEAALLFGLLFGDHGSPIRQWQVLGRGAFRL